MLEQCSKKRFEMNSSHLIDFAIKMDYENFERFGNRLANSSFVEAEYVYFVHTLAALEKHQKVS